MRVIQLYEDSKGALYTAQLEDGACVAMTRQVGAPSGISLNDDLILALRHGLQGRVGLVMEPEDLHRLLEVAADAEKGMVRTAAVRPGIKPPAIVLTLDMDRMGPSTRRFARLDG